MKVQELMTRDVVTFASDASLKDVADAFLTHGISGAPVCDDEGHVLGVISKADIVARQQGGVDRPLTGLARLVRRKEVRPRTEATTAGEAMTRPPVTVVAYLSAAGAAQLMHETGVHRLPVVDNGGKLVGIVTQTDLVRAFNRTDEAIAREIRDELRWQLPDLPAAEEERPTVDVKGGAVVLRGRLERRSDIDTLEHVVRRVPGVVSLNLDVTWKIDDRDVSQAAT